MYIYIYMHIWGIDTIFRYMSLGGRGRPRRPRASGTLFAPRSWVALLVSRYLSNTASSVF